MKKEKDGVIYILTNPSFPEYVKIGYAANVQERLRSLNRSECIPFAFRVYATYEVSVRLGDKVLHSLIDRLNPGLRVDFSHYFRWLFANFRDCSLSS